MQTASRAFACFSVVRIKFESFLVGIRRSGILLQGFQRPSSPHVAFGWNIRKSFIDEARPQHTTRCTVGNQEMVGIIWMKEKEAAYTYLSELSDVVQCVSRNKNLLWPRRAIPSRIIVLNVVAALKAKSFYRQNQASRIDMAERRSIIQSFGSKAKKVQPARRNPCTI